MSSKRKTRIAIACQGGGSQTAFSAGVLKALVNRAVENDFEVVSISGASGGAVCAELAWYGLLKGDDPFWSRLIRFWGDNMAQHPIEHLLNAAAVHMFRLANSGYLPASP